jgi:hypothetical protein
MLKRHCEARAAGRPIEQEKRNGRRTKSILTLTDREPHLVGLHAEFLCECFPQRDHKSIGGAAPKWVLRLEF